MKTPPFLLGLVITSAALAAAPVSAGSWKLSSGIDYTSGDYGGTDDVTTLYAPFNVKYRGGRYGLRLTVPYLEVNGPGAVLGAEGQLVPGPDRTDSGLGDVIVAATVYDVVALEEQRFYFDLTAKAKFGTADEEKGLGTGESDYSLQGEWYREFERSGLFGTFGYKVYGDPSGVDLDDAAFVSLGGDYRLATATRAGVIYDYRESAARDGDALQELTLFLSFATGNGMSLQPYILGGLSDSSPRLGRRLHGELEGRLTLKLLVSTSLFILFGARHEQIITDHWHSRRMRRRRLGVCARTTTGTRPLAYARPDAAT